MGASLVTSPTAEPLTLAEMRAHLRVDVTDDDAIIATLLATAREWVEGETKLKLVTQTWDFTWDRGWPLDLMLRLPVAPVSSVTSVKYVDESGATQTLSAALYTAVLDREHPRIVPAYGAEWPTVRDVPNAVTVRAVCGYGDANSDVPQPLRQAIKLLVGHWHENREAANIGNIVTPLPFAVEALISPYRRTMWL